MIDCSSKKKLILSSKRENLTSKGKGDKNESKKMDI